MSPRLSVFLCLTGVVLAAATAAADEAPNLADPSSDALEDADATSSFAFDPLAMACGIVRTELDFAFGRSVAVNLDAGVYRHDAHVWGLVGVGLLIYPFGPAFHGFYVEPRLTAARALSENLASGGAGGSLLADAGWQWTWDYGLTFRLGAGLAASTRDFAANAPRFEKGSSAERWALVAQTALGWVW